MARSRDAAEALAIAIEELASAYPTDNDLDLTPITIRITDTGQPVREVPIQPGQARWLTGLIMDELATAREAHTDGSGACMHCTPS